MGLLYSSSSVKTAEEDGARISERSAKLKGFLFLPTQYSLYNHRIGRFDKYVGVGVDYNSRGVVCVISTNKTALSFTTNEWDALIASSDKALNSLENEYKSSFSSCSSGATLRVSPIFGNWCVQIIRLDINGLENRITLSKCEFKRLMSYVKPIQARIALLLKELTTMLYTIQCVVYAVNGSILSESCWWFSQLTEEVNTCLLAESIENN